MRFTQRCLFGFVASLIAVPSFAQSTAFRFNDLDLRDPHIFTIITTCLDVTTSFNNAVQTAIQSDGNGDGKFDTSYLIAFDPLDQAGSGGPIRFGLSSCTTPSVSCGPSESLVEANSTNVTMGQCLGTLPGTTRVYTPPITTPVGPCFVSGEMEAYLDLGGIPMTLRHAQVAATYVGSPATSLASGLLRGFLTEADANSTIIPASFGILGGRRLSSVLPGGMDNCRSGPNSDMDVLGDGTRGWWMYFNFTASPVPYTGPQLSAPARDGTALAIASVNPSRLPLRVEYRLDREGPARLSLHDLSGRLVADLSNGRRPAGTHHLVWDGNLARGGSAPPGMYLIRLATAGGTIARRVIVLK